MNKGESSFSEEKEAKRLCLKAALRRMSGAQPS
jgi:hypothetical protein